MRSFTQSGILIKVYDAETKGNFKTREFVIQIENGQYPQFAKFQLTQDRCDLIEPYIDGTCIKVHFDLRGREWQGKYFTNLNAWRIESEEAAIPAPTNTVQSAPAPVQPEPGTVQPEADDLPF